MIKASIKIRVCVSKSNSEVKLVSDAAGLVWNQTLQVDEYNQIIIVQIPPSQMIHPIAGDFFSFRTKPKVEPSAIQIQSNLLV